MKRVVIVYLVITSFVVYSRSTELEKIHNIKTNPYYIHKRIKELQQEQQQFEPIETIEQISILKTKLKIFEEKYDTLRHRNKKAT